ncbi:hypothetical protein EC968_009257, partial [Mortierella alpina]
MQKILDIATAFFKIHGIEINAKKTVVLALNPSGQDQDRTLTYGTPPEQLTPIPKNEATRILGVWVNATGAVTPTQNLVENDVKTICGILRRKAVTDRQVVYIINNVLLPRIAYKISIQVLCKSWLVRLTGMYMKLCKSKCRLPSTTPNSVQHHHRLGAIRALEDVQAEEQIPSLHSRLNDDGLIGRLARERLIALQARAEMAVQPTARPDLVKKSKHSLTSSVCEIMAERSVAFSVDLRADLNVDQYSMTVAEWGGRWISEETLKILSGKRILYAEQLFTGDKTELISWSALRSRFNFKCKSTPSWYLELTDAANREERSAATWRDEWIANRRTQIQEAMMDIGRPLIIPEILTEAESEDMSETSSDDQTESEAEVPGILPLPAAAATILPPPGAARNVPPQERPPFSLDNRASTKRFSETWRQRNERKERYIKRGAPVRGKLTEYARDNLECEFERKEKREEKEWLKWEEQFERQEQRKQRLQQQREQQRLDDERRKRRLQREKAKLQRQQQRLEAKRHRQVLKQRVAQDRRRRALTDMQRQRRAKEKHWSRYSKMTDAKLEDTLAKEAWKALSNNSTQLKEYETMDDFGPRRSMQKELWDDVVKERTRLEEENLDKLTFYSDGSLKDMGKESVSMAFGVVQKKGDNQYRDIVGGQTEGHASSTKAELVGLLAAIMISPRDRDVQVFIDNEGVVKKFRTL